MYDDSGIEIKHAHTLLVHESEKQQMRKYLKSREGVRIDMESLRKEIIERFFGWGFKVRVNFYECGINGQRIEGEYIPEVVIEERLTPFDYDREVHEAVHDIKGEGKVGWIKEDGTIKSPATKVHIPKKIEE